MGRTTRGLIIFSAVALAAACGGHLPTPRKPARPDLCAAACSHLRDLGCPEGEPTPGGATCEDWCTAVEDSGAATLNPECLAGVKSCSEVDACVE